MASPCQAFSGAVVYSGGRYLSLTLLSPGGFFSFTLSVFKQEMRLNLVASFLLLNICVPLLILSQILTFVLTFIALTWTSLVVDPFTWQFSLTILYSNLCLDSPQNDFTVQKEGCYGLNACVPTKFISWSPNPQCDCICLQDLEEVIKVKWDHRVGPNRIGLVSL